MNEFANTNDWYKRASSGRLPSSEGFSHRFGSQWLKYRVAYLQMIEENRLRFNAEHNPQASRLIYYHGLGVPKHLPYMFEMPGFEWPVIASCLHWSMANTRDERYRLALQSLYTIFVSLNRSSRDG